MIEVTIIDRDWGVDKPKVYQCDFAMPVKEYYTLQKAGELGDESDHLAICKGQRLVRDNMVWEREGGYTVCGFNTAQDVSESELVYVKLHRVAKKIKALKEIDKRHIQLLAKYAAP